jgi:hypothetical protein
MSTRYLIKDQKLISNLINEELIILIRKGNI